MPSNRPRAAAAFTLLTYFGLSLPLAGHADAQSAPQSPGRTLEPLMACRNIDAAEARLACFDRETAAISGQGQVAIITPDDVRENQRRAFGFSANFINPFASGGQDELQEISANTTEVRDLGRNQWRITLDDGSVWRKTDNTAVSFSTRRQYPATVRRAALGSYLMKVGDRPAFRVQRQ